jgi:hypothetical protein
LARRTKLPATHKAVAALSKSIWCHVGRIFLQFSVSRRRWFHPRIFRSFFMCVAQWSILLPCHAMPLPFLCSTLDQGILISGIIPSGTRASGRRTKLILRKKDCELVYEMVVTQADTLPKDQATRKDAGRDLQVVEEIDVRREVFKGVEDGRFRGGTPAGHRRVRHGRLR